MNSERVARCGMPGHPGGPALILASGSPRRAALLQTLGVRFRVVVSSAPETAPGHLVPREICLANAVAKAHRVAADHPADLVLGADTEVALGLRVFGKPSSRAEAVRFLQALSGRTHEVITGVCLVCRDLGIRRAFAVTTRVTFHPLGDRQIRRYLSQVDAMDKAGAYAVQEEGEQLIEDLEGSLTNVVGLPLGALRRELHRLARGHPTLRRLVAGAAW